MVLTTHDIQTIEKLGYEPRFFVSERNEWVQLKNKNGRCVFHNGTVCTIYDHRPEGCVLYPIVYDKDHRCAILDSDCPQKHCFPLSETKSEQLYSLISSLEKERAGRKKEKKIK
jgi:Fe-S-cluster containining protein